MERTALATALALGLAATAAAQEPAGNDPANQVSFAQADKNGDGRVNREESNVINGFDFSGADTNDDRVLTRQEFAAATARPTSPGAGEKGALANERTDQVTFKQADKNKDGKIDRDEAEDIDGFNFAAADADDDRLLSREEFRTAMSESRPGG